MPHLPQAHTDELALDPERLAHAYDLLDAWTRGPSPPIPAAALLVGRRGRTLEPRFFGRQGPAADDPPIRRDAIFLLASVTKPVTYLAAMLLVERGLLALSDPVVRYFPDFAAHHKEQTRVLHLFTHTSGLTDMLPNNLELRAAHAPLARFLEHTVRDTVPLFPPGTNLSYQSMGTLLVAAIVEKITGLPLPQFLQRELFEPLGMDSTSLGAGSLPRQRLVAAQARENIRAIVGVCLAERAMTKVLLTDVARVDPARAAAIARWRTAREAETELMRAFELAKRPVISFDQPWAQRAYRVYVQVAPVR